MEQTALGPSGRVCELADPSAFHGGVRHGVARGGWAGLLSQEGSDSMPDRRVIERFQDGGEALTSLDPLTTGRLLPNWLHGRQPILPDEGETKALPKHR